MTQDRFYQPKANYADQAWGLPGGALDMGETIHQALLLSAKEELGCQVRIDYLSGVYFHSAVTSHTFIFRCHLAVSAEDQAQLMNIWPMLGLI